MPKKVCAPKKADCYAEHSYGTHGENVNYVTHNYLWVYIVAALLVLLVIFWYGSTADVKARLDDLNVVGVEWLTSSSGKMMLGLFTFVAVLLFAWAASYSSGWYRMLGDTNKCNLIIGFFVVTVLVMLAGSILFLRGSYSTAYWLALLVALMGVIATVYLAYVKATGPAVAAGIFTLWALVMSYATYKVKEQNASVSI
jgi:hypothetical protein